MQVRLGCGIPHMGYRPERGGGSVGIFLKDPTRITQVSEKITEIFEWLGRQARPRIEPGTSRQPILRAEFLGH